MNDLTNQITSKLLPKEAIIVYHNNEDHQYYLEQRAIKDGKMCSGRPLSSEAILKIINFLNPKKGTKKKIIEGLIPKNLLYFSHEKDCGIWYNEPQKRMMYFTKNLNVKDGERMMPGLIYRVENRHMDIYAFEGDLNEETPLYFAPFMNASANSICLGDAKVDDTNVNTYQDYIMYWEKMFWMSKFSHTGIQQINVNMVSLLQELLNTDKPFPFDVIKKTNKKLNSIIP